jgi:hypothetical protein
MHSLKWIKKIVARQGYNDRNRHKILINYVV